MLRRSLAWLLLAGLGGSTPAGLAVAQETGGAEPAQALPLEVPNTWYAQALAYSDVGINVTHFWSKDQKLRAETVIAGRRIVTIVSGNFYYAYDATGNNGIAVGRSEVALRQDASRKRPFGNEVDAVVRQGAEPVGVEQLGGREVEVFRVTDGLGRRQVWATRDELRLPLRIEIYRRSNRSKLRTDFLSWQRGLPLSEEFFSPPSGLVLVRLSYDEYIAKQAERKPFGPVPVLYGDLLHGQPD